MWASLAERAQPLFSFSPLPLGEAERVRRTRYMWPSHFVEAAAMTAKPEQNPLLAPNWDDTLGLPPFARIKPEHFLPALETAMADHLKAIDKIVAAPSASFDNMIGPFETSGLPLNRVAGAFFHLAGVDTNDQIQAIERDIAPKLARHHSQIYLNEALFRRIDDHWTKRDRLGRQPPAKTRRMRHRRATLMAVRHPFTVWRRARNRSKSPLFAS